MYILVYPCYIYITSAYLLYLLNYYYLFYTVTLILLNNRVNRIVYYELWTCWEMYSLEYWLYYVIHIPTFSGEIA